MSKREMLAKAMEWTGLTAVLERYGNRPGLLVINHHRIGNAQRSRFDRGVFSDTAEQLDWQVAYLKRRFPIVAGQELVELVRRPELRTRMFIGITFDDGYLDNYRNAFPVLKSHDCGAMFFLIPEYVGTAAIPWWDEIAYLVRNASGSLISLSYPSPLRVTLMENREPAILAVLRHYKRPDNRHPEVFLAQLRSAAQCVLPNVDRRFLSWEEAREMQAAGMTIGSHTRTHRILSQLSEDDQRGELVQSRALLETQLGQTVDLLAYPVGIRKAFNATTEKLARSAGYECCFSFYGGVNAGRRKLRTTNVRRASIEPQPLMFRHQVAVMSSMGRLFYPTNPG